MWKNAGSQISALAFEVEIYLLHFYWTRYPVTSESHPESHVVPCSLMRVPPYLARAASSFFHVQATAASSALINYRIDGRHY